MRRRSSSSCRRFEEHAVVYFCLPALEFPALARLVGKLVINDLKSAAAAQLTKPKARRLPFYAIFDEFSVFAGEQVLNLINMGRGAGVHAVLATQSVADIGRAVTKWARIISSGRFFPAATAI